jgi:alkylation response protein AidB-like acyl-CoA dehydrogenase
MLMEFDWSQEELEFRQELRTFVEAHVPEEWRRVPVGRYVMTAEDRQRTLAFTHELGKRGWLTPHWPVEYGGSGMPTWRHVILGEEMWSVGEPRGPQYMSVNWIGPAILAFGSEEQKAFHLTQISRGEAFWCQGFSEPDAGSDLASLRTSAVLDGDHYVVNGQKIWTSHTPSAEWCFLLVRTDPEAAKGKGITILLVPMDTPGIEVRPIPNLAEEAAFAEVFLTDVKVPVAFRLGPENGGWDVVRRALQNERVGSPRWERAARVLDAVASWAAEHGRLGDPYVLERLGEARAACEAARYIAYSVIDERARGVPPSAQAYVARIAMVRADKLVAETVFDIMGQGAVDNDSLAAQNYFGALTAGVAAGSYEVNLNLIARQVLSLPRS